MTQAGNNRQTIGRYEIKKLLGRGGMASVYLAHDPHFGRDVAVKVLPREFLHDPQFLNRFQREARTIASLDHPAIVPVYDYGEDDGQPFLVMRYMAGGSLAEQLRIRDIPLSETIHIIRRIASALDEAHTNGIVHRDLKPGNVLFDHRNDAFLSDFGIVKMTEGTATFTTGTGVIGTPAYMSPEQVHGDREIDGRSDVYTLGVMLFQMVSGEMPYKADTPVKQMMAHVLEPVPNIRQLRPDLPAGFNGVISKALAKNRDERFPTATNIVDALETLTNPGQPTPQRPTFSTPANASPTTAAPAATPDDPTATILYNTETITNAPQVQAESAEATTEQSNRPWYWYAGGGLLAIITLIAIIAFATNTPTPDPTPTTAILIAAATKEPTTDTSSAEATTATEQSVTEPTTAATAAATPTDPPATSTPVPTPTTQPTSAPTPIPPTEEALAESPPYGAEIELGRSASNLPITAIRFGDGPKNIVFIGGLHAGFAPASVTLAETVIQELENDPDLVPTNASIYIIPNLNPDSTYNPGELSGRLNDNGVDLNRNWDCRWQADDTFRGELIEGVGGTAPFSEPEITALSTWLLDLQPVAVIFWQARATNGLVSPGSCRSTTPQVSAALGDIYSEATGYGLQDFEQLAQEPVNGDAVNWIDSQGIPAISVLLPDYLDEDTENNLAAVAAVLDRFGK